MKGGTHMGDSGRILSNTIGGSNRLGPLHGRISSWIGYWPRRVFLSQWSVPQINSAVRPLWLRPIRRVLVGRWLSAPSFRSSCDHGPASGGRQAMEPTYWQAIYC